MEQAIDAVGCVRGRELLFPNALKIFAAPDPDDVLGPGTCRNAGAKALLAVTGKLGWPARAGSVKQPLDPLGLEAIGPAFDPGRPAVELCGDSFPPLAFETEDHGSQSEPDWRISLETRRMAKLVDIDWGTHGRQLRGKMPEIVCPVSE